MSSPGVRGIRQADPEGFALGSPVVRGGGYRARLPQAHSAAARRCFYALRATIKFAFAQLTSDRQREDCGQLRNGADQSRSQ